jgi:hypothetical protein
VYAAGHWNADTQQIHLMNNTKWLLLSLSLPFKILDLHLMAYQQLYQNLRTASGQEVKALSLATNMLFSTQCSAYPLLPYYFIPPNPPPFSPSPLCCHLWASLQGTRSALSYSQSQKCTIAEKYTNSIMEKGHW